MFLRKLIFIFTVLLLQTTQAQKKKADTIFVYEKVIVYDTIYLEKTVKSKANGIQISLPTVKDQFVENRIFKVKKITPKKTFSKVFNTASKVELVLKTAVGQEN